MYRVMMTREQVVQGYLARESETQGSSLSAAFVHSPDLPEHQSLQLLQ